MAKEWELALLALFVSLGGAAAWLFGGLEWVVAVLIACAVLSLIAISNRVEALEKKVERAEAALSRHNERLWELEIWAGKQQGEQ